MTDKTDLNKKFQSSRLAKYAKILQLDQEVDIVVGVRDGYESLNHAISNVRINS